MFPNQFIQRVKKARLPYHLTYEDIEGPTAAYSGELDAVQELRQLFWLPEAVNPANTATSPHDNKPTAFLDVPKPTELPHSISLTHGRYSVRIENLLKEYIDHSAHASQLTNRKLKCSSLERVSPTELCKFSTFAHLLKTTKKTVYCLF